MKKFGLYLLLALVTVISLLLTSACAPAAAPARAPAMPPATPAVPTTPTQMSATVSSQAPSGSSDLVITKVWLDDITVHYTIRNTGTADSPQTNAYVYVNDLFPAQGGTSFVDTLKPGQEQERIFSNYGWPYGRDWGEITYSIAVDPRGWVELPLKNYNVKVCAEGHSDGCRMTIVGVLWDYDLLSVANQALWRNADGEVPEPGSEAASSIHGAHFQRPNADMAVRPDLETIPQQVPNGWIQGIWGFIYSDPDFHARKIAAIQVPAKLHFQAKVGLASYATGTDGVTLRLGLRDLNDQITWIASKNLSTPGSFEDWDVNLGKYEGGKYTYLLRVDAGNSPVNDFVVWKEARLLQVND